ncbi:MAG: AMP-binding protein [Hyphomicrobiales bacterium]
MSDDNTLPALLDGGGADPALVVDGEAVSFADLGRRSAALAAGLSGIGVGSGDRVAVWLPNRADWLITLFALSRLGAVGVAVNTRFRAAEIEDIVGRAGCTALIYEPGFKGIDFERILAEVDPAALTSLKHLVTCGGTATHALPGVNAVRMADLLCTPPASLPGPHPDDGVIVFTTSGTTSRPKFVLHTQASLAIHAREVARAFDYGADDTVLLQALPLCGTFGLAQALAGIAARRPSVVMPSFDAAEAVRLIRTYKVTSFNGSDEMFARIADRAGPSDLASIAWCGFAAFANARFVDFVEQCARRGLRLAGLYGMSEVQALYARQPVDAAPETRALAGGVPTSPAARVEVRDPDTGETLAPGVTGELYLKGPSRFLEYMGDADAAAAALTPDGFVRSGDLGYLTENGGFVFETRMGDGIRLGGFLVNPAEIDAWLERHDAVAACQTVGIDVECKVQPVSFVIPADRGAAGEAALLDHCRQGLAGHKVPHRVFKLDRFPTTDGPNGEKIQRGELRTMARERV